MPSLFDRLRRRKQEPEPEGLYSPAERGGQDPDPSQFNVGDTVRAAGTSQAGAVAVADGVRRPLPDTFVVPDGTVGTIKGVDLDNIFVAFPVHVPSEPWRGAPEFNPGDRLKSVAEVPTQYGTIPKNHVAHVLDAPGTDDMMRVQLMLQFPKKDWWNTREPELRRWGQSVLVVDPEELARCAALDPAVERLMNNEVSDVRTLLMGAPLPRAIRAGNRYIVLQASNNPGDYTARGAVEWRGLPIGIEHFEGESRPPVGNVCPVPYGYFDDTKAMDGDGVDVQLGPNWTDEDADVWVAEQLAPDGSGELVQYKVYLGFDTEDQVREAFLAMWPERMLGDIDSCSADEFINEWFPKLNTGGES